MKIKYSRDYKPPAPRIRATLFTRLGEYRLELIVDTGFSGGILIPYQLYSKLGLALFEVPDRYYGVLPIGVQIPLHTALAKVNIGNLRFKTHIHSHPLLNRKLIGGELLNQMKILLNGPMEELEIIEEY